MPWAGRSRVRFTITSLGFSNEPYPTSRTVMQHAAHVVTIRPIPLPSWYHREPRDFSTPRPNAPHCSVPIRLSDQQHSICTGTDIHHDPCLHVTRVSSSGLLTDAVTLIGRVLSPFEQYDFHLQTKRRLSKPPSAHLTARCTPHRICAPHRKLQ
jgi:hypothetical protein